MIKVLISFVILISVASCGDDSATSDAEKLNQWTSEKSLESIKNIETQLSQVKIETIEDVQKARRMRITLRDSLLSFMIKYPKHDKNQTILLKTYLNYSALDDQLNTLEIGNRLLNEYPALPDRKSIIQSQILVYTAQMDDLDSNKIAGLYKMLIDENLEENQEIAKENKDLYNSFSGN